MISPEEVVLISAYSRSELIGGCILAEWAKKTKDDFLRAKLTHHAAEELTHADYWAQTLESAGHKLVEVHDVSRRQYYALAKEPQNEMEVLLMAEALEPIALSHYQAYAKVEGIDDAIRATLNKIIEEETEHADWISDWLEQYPDQKAVAVARKSYEKAINQAYTDELDRLEAAGGILAKIAAVAKAAQSK